MIGSKPIVYAPTKASLTGLEPVTYRVETDASIQLRYKDSGLKFINMCSNNISKFSE